MSFIDIYTSSVFDCRMNMLTYIALTLAVICTVSDAQFRRFQNQGGLVGGRQLSAADRRGVNGRAVLDNQRQRGTVSSLILYISLIK